MPSVRPCCHDASMAEHQPDVQVEPPTPATNGASRAAGSLAPLYVRWCPECGWTEVAADPAFLLDWRECPCCGLLRAAGVDGLQ